MKSYIGICDCTTTHLSNIEKGKIGVSLLLLFRISVATNKTLDYFVMDNPHVDTAIKINSELAPILLEYQMQRLL